MFCTYLRKKPTIAMAISQEKHWWRLYTYLREIRDMLCTYLRKHKNTKRRVSYSHISGKPRGCSVLIAGNQPWGTLSTSQKTTGKSYFPISGRQTISRDAQTIRLFAFLFSLLYNKKESFLVRRSLSWITVKRSISPTHPSR